MPATESTYEELLDSIFTTLPSIDAMDKSTLELHHPETSTEPVSKPLQNFYFHIHYQVISENILIKI